MSTRIFATAVTGLLLAACSTVYAPNQRLVDTPRPSNPLVWRVDSACISGDAPWQALRAGTREELARACWNAAHQSPASPLPNRDLVFVAMSGGGAKAAVFSGESMFYLQAIGLLQKTAMVSSVSGGSFAAAYYALSCEAADAPCQDPTASGVLRPLWRYEDAMPVMQSGFQPMLVRAAINLFIPGKTTPVPHQTFGEFIDRHYLRRQVDGVATGAGPARFTDVNPRRPMLVLNSTLLSGARPLSETTFGRHFLRRRTADEFLHFAFSDYYFNRIGADLNSYAVSDAVAASAAFPALIGYAALKNYAGCADAADRAVCENDPKTMLTLTDGGANDNQGLIEVFASLAELAAHEARSDLSLPGRPSPRLEPMQDGDRSLVIVLNSSLTEATGVDSPLEKDYLFGTIDRALSAVDAYSAVGFNLRKRLYFVDLEALRHERKLLGLTAVEIGLAPLNRYPDGGAELGIMKDAGVLGDAMDQAERTSREAQVRTQADAFAYVRTDAARRFLQLGNLHPQCLFEQSKLADAGVTSLAHLPDRHAVCLRQAARWATALRGEELCQAEHHARGSVMADPAALHCTPDGHLRLAAGVLGALPECNMTLDTADEAAGVRHALSKNAAFMASLPPGRRIDGPLSEACALDGAGTAILAETTP